MLGFLSAVGLLLRLYSFLRILVLHFGFLLSGEHLKVLNPHGPCMSGKLLSYYTALNMYPKWSPVFYVQ